MQIAGLRGLTIVFDDIISEDIIEEVLQAANAIRPVRAFSYVQDFEEFTKQEKEKNDAD